jgi:hypothetical protein
METPIRPATLTAKKRREVLSGEMTWGNRMAFAFMPLLQEKHPIRDSIKKIEARALKLELKRTQKGDKSADECKRIIEDLVAEADRWDKKEYLELAQRQHELAKGFAGVGGIHRLNYLTQFYADPCLFYGILSEKEQQNYDNIVHPENIQQFLNYMDMAAGNYKTGGNPKGAFECAILGARHASVHMKFERLLSFLNFAKTIGDLPPYLQEKLEKLPAMIEWGRKAGELNAGLLRRKIENGKLEQPPYPELLHADLAEKLAMSKRQYENWCWYVAEYDD